MWNRRSHLSSYGPLIFFVSQPNYADLVVRDNLEVFYFLFVGRFVLQRVHFFSQIKYFYCPNPGL